MFWRLAFIGILLAGLCVATAANENQGRETPPPGRALPPTPELSAGLTVTGEGQVVEESPAAGGDNQDRSAQDKQQSASAAAKAVRSPALLKAMQELAAAKAEHTAQAEPKPATRSFRLERPSQPSASLKREPRLPQPQLVPPLPLDNAAQPETAASDGGESAAEDAARGDALAPAGGLAALPPTPGKLAKDPLEWRRLGKAPANPLPAQSVNALSAPRTTFSSGPLGVFAAGFSLPGANLLDISTAFQLDRRTRGPSSNFGSRNVPRSNPPVELVLPALPARPPQPAVPASLSSLSRGNVKAKRVALTFDDGPHPEYTSQLLAVLDYYDVRATFFVVGVQAQKYPQWVKMIHQAGHELANHTFDHFRLPNLPLEEKIYQIDECKLLLEQLTGTTPRFFRPPGGRYDSEVERLLRQRGMVLALWDVGLNDTAEDREAADLLSTASREVRPGSVVLGHDGIQATVDMLPQLIQNLRKNGYEFVTMSEMAAGL